MRLRLRSPLTIGLVWLVSVFAERGSAADFSITVRQITTGPANHFFGYIGHVQNIPWNGSGRYIVALRTTFSRSLARCE
jgi:hypothetical protein